MRAVFVVNSVAPGARRLRSCWSQVRDILALHGWSVEVEPTSYPTHATALARAAASSGASLVVAFGGDGTVSEVVNGLAGTDTIFGVIPGGTTNVWARQIAMPFDPIVAVRALVEGEVHVVDLGFGAGRYFVMMAGVGFDGYVMRMVSHSMKRWLGVGAYLLAGVFTGLRFRSTRATITTNGKAREVAPFHLLVAGNTRHYAFVDITREAYADDGLLDICTFSGAPPFTRRLLHLANVIAGRHLGSGGVCYERAAAVMIETERPMPVQMDGDYVCQTPVTLCAAPGALRMLLPHRRYPFLHRADSLAPELDVAR